ncbi:MAG: protein kinase [Polyangiaceae bacterium]
MPIREDIIERTNARLGTVLKGKWRLDAVIGIGGMASVYAATHRNQARVAIQLLHAEVALDAEVTARFLREGYVANAVGHPGAVTVLDDDISEDKAPFLVMELLIGQTLDTMLAIEPEGLAGREVLKLLDQLLEVLTAAHEKGIVHRDLKPENLCWCQRYWRALPRAHKTRATRLPLKSCFAKAGPPRKRRTSPARVPSFARAIAWILPSAPCSTSPTVKRSSGA